jgi:hypothetical protein
MVTTALMLFYYKKDGGTMELHYIKLVNFQHLPIVTMLLKTSLSLTRGTDKLDSCICKFLKKFPMFACADAIASLSEA